MIKDAASSADWGEPDDSVYILRLFVAGTSPASVRAINNLQAILNERLKDRHELEIIDVHQQPQMVQTEDVTAIPMLVKQTPLPKRRLVGDMSDKSRVLRGLGLS